MKRERKQCTPDRNCETRLHDCEYFKKMFWRSYADGRTGAYGECSKLGKEVFYEYFKEPPCEPKQTTLI